VEARAQALAGQPAHLAAQEAPLEVPLHLLGKVLLAVRELLRTSMVAVAVVVLEVLGRTDQTPLPEMADLPHLVL
jgi:hypothetical protein